MGKKFLDILGDAFEEDMLEEVIPTPRKKSAPVRRKKRFTKSLAANLPEEPKQTKRPTSKRGNSLLDTLEEALDNQVFDDIFPKARPRRRKAGTPAPAPDPDLEIRFSTMITSEVLERARQIALSKGVRVKEVINAALRIYIEKES